MNKKKNNSTAVSVRLNSDIKIISASPPVFRSGVIQFLLIAMLPVASIAVGMSFNDTAFSMLIVSAYCALGSYLLCLCKNKIPAIGFLGGTALLSFFFRSSIVQGVAVAACDFYRLYDEPIPRSVLRTASQTDISDKSCVTLALIALSGIILIVLFLCIYIKTNFIVTFILTFPLPELGIYNGAEPNYFWALTLVALWVCVFSLQIGDYSKNKSTNASDFTADKKGKVYNLTSSNYKLSAYGQVTASICIIVTLVYFMSIFGTAVSGYRRSDNADILRSHLGTDFSLESLQAAFDEIKGIEQLPEELTSPLEELFNKKNYASEPMGLSMGEILGNADISGTQSDKTVLIVEYDREITDVPLYLRAYSSSKYENSAWVDRQTDLYDFIMNGGYDFLGFGPDEDFSMRDFPDAASTLMFTNLKMYEIPEYYLRNSTVNFSITDVTKRSGLYFEPYFGGLMNNGVTIVNDNYGLNDSDVSLSTAILPIGISPADLYSNEGLDALSKWDDYPYVIDYLKGDDCQYTEVCVDINEKVIDYIDGKLASSGMTGSYEENKTVIIDALKDYFNTNYTYSLKNPETPEGEDFVEYFLNEMDTGSCSYFASAGAQILRYYGIPTRYVEGYLISADDLSKGVIEENGHYYYKVTGKESHAWVEYFDERIGWLPLEFTVSRESGQTQPPATTTTTQTSEPDDTTTTTTTTTTAATNTNTAATTSTALTTSGSGQSEVVTTLAADKKDGVNVGKYVTSIVTIIAIIAVIAGIYLLVRSACIRKMEEEISGDDTNENAANLYRQILMYLALIGIKHKGNITDSMHAKIIAYKLSERGLKEIADDFVIACAIAVEADMSDESICDGDASSLRAYHGKIRELVYENLGVFRKFVAKYIRHLY